MILDEKFSQDYPVNSGFPQCSILGATLFLLYINDFPGDFICDIAIYADDTTLYYKPDQASDLLKQQKMASELESVLRDTVDWGRKWLVGSNADKNLLVQIALIGIHSMLDSTATTRHGFTRKRNTKRLRHTENLFRKNLQLKHVC